LNKEFSKNSYFFIGIAGTGMSAIAQYLKAAGHHVAGSDRQFVSGDYNESRDALEAEGIICFEQGAGGVTADTDVVVVSTAIEDSVPEVQQAKALSKPIIKRSALLAEIVTTKKTIAVAGTSGKSTTTAMLYEILYTAGLHPSVIGGAGLTRLINQGKIGNAAYGEGEWLIIEADESDGSIVQYHPEIGLLLNIDKDHQEMDELMNLFSTFKQHSSTFITNLTHRLSASLSAGSPFDFVCSENRDQACLPVGMGIGSREKGINTPKTTTVNQDNQDNNDNLTSPKTILNESNFNQLGAKISFQVNGQAFEINTPGRHNMENAMAAIAVASSIGIDLATCSRALSNYEGIYRRHQVYGEKKGVILVDDFAHNPVKCARSMEACQPFSDKLIAWFQPHGYGPTRFLRNDFVVELSKVVRPQDEIWMSEIYYAGGTAVKDISAEDLINDLKAMGVNAYFVSDRNQLLDAMHPHFTASTTLLLMGARDPSLGEFAKQVWENL
jgi:UDP-N-acetylmuramate--alanine ligase